MPYDAKLDQCLVSKQWEGEMSRIVVSIFAYNQGQKKLQISRENKTPEGEYRFTKLGRMTKDEAKAILPLMQELLPQME